MGDRIKLKRALISVYDKTGVVELAKALCESGCEIVSTGSTAALLDQHDVPVVRVEEFTGTTEMLGGRVKTLHPRIHAGLLADRRLAEHESDAKLHSIDEIDLLVVNLYPFAQTVAMGADETQCVEQIDIGGPAMIRSAAKNFGRVAVVVSPNDYQLVSDSLRAGGFDVADRRRLAAKAFDLVAKYDAEISNWFSRDDHRALTVHGELVKELRYGENPHQVAWLYATEEHRPSVTNAKILSGKEMSYNNYVDADSARRAAFDHLEPCVAIIKHANPCGVAIAETLVDAYRNSLACDPVSAFGGVVATNRPVDLATASAMSEMFLELVIAPGFSDEAVEMLSLKQSLRLVLCEGPHPGKRREVRFISGGFLAQDEDSMMFDGSALEAWNQVSGGSVDEALARDLEFAWRCVRAPHSNAIVLAKSGATVGIGMGQVNRVDAVRLAVQRAGTERSYGSVAASDAFFPFPDGVEQLLAAGVKAIVQPGGSVRDAEAIAVAEAAEVVMFMTGRRHFSH